MIANTHGYSCHEIRFEKKILICIEISFYDNWTEDDFNYLIQCNILNTLHMEMPFQRYLIAHPSSCGECCLCMIKVATFINYLHVVYKQRLLLRCIHHFKSDYINNMNHIFRILNPNHWSLAKKLVSKVGKRWPKSTKQAEAKKDGVVNPQNYKFRSILTRKILMLANAYNNSNIIIIAINL